MAWIDTGSFTGGDSPMVQYAEIVRLDRHKPIEHPTAGWRGTLVLKDGSTVYCQATMPTMRKRLLEAEDVAEVAPALTLLLKGAGRLDDPVDLRFRLSN